MFSRDFGGTRFSPLADINAENAGTAGAGLVGAAHAAGRAARRSPPASDGAQPQGRGAARPWPAAARRRRGEEGEAAGSNPEVTPIVVNGVMYLPARGNQVLALDGDTGKEIWRYQMPPTITTTARGVAYWPGEASIPPRIILTAGPQAAGARRRDRPARGRIRPQRHDRDSRCRGTACRSIYKHVAILGAYPGEVPLGPTGDTRAFDLRTGKKLWQFQNVPLPGQVGHETWLDYGWRDRSGTNVWAFYMTLDAERGILYMPVSAPAANYWGGDRPGANLFANSIVAVDAETGKYRWHFQTVHHDIWDFDMPSPPVLVDITQNGRRVPALASIGKIGLHVHPQPRHRQTDLRRRGAAGAQGRRAGRVVLADAAVSGQAGAVVRARRVRQGARHGARRKTPRRSTRRNARRCGTRAAASTTPVRSRRSCFTRTARRRGAACSSPAPAAA